MDKGEQRSMSAYIRIVIGVLSVTRCLFSHNLNCTKPTTSCPTAAQWSERAKIFDCPGSKRYVCLMTLRDELREGCIFNSTIQAGRIGCPYTKQCDIRTDQPLLVTANNYLLCPPDYNGCPPRNHSGYSILEIYKYARCQGINSSDESSVSPVKVTGSPTTIVSSNIPRYVNWTIGILSLAVGLIAIFFTVILIVCLKKCKNSENVNRKPSEGDFSTIPVDSIRNNTRMTEKDTIYTSKITNTTRTSTNKKLFTISSGPLRTINYSEQRSWSKDSALFRNSSPYSSFSSDSTGSLTVMLPLPCRHQNHKRYPMHSFKASDSSTSLHTAALNGDIDSVKRLIDIQADVNAKDSDSNTSLHTAALNGDIDSVKRLIYIQADVNAKDSHHGTPLHTAVARGNVDVVKILIDAKADVNAMSVLHGTPLHTAVARGNVDVVKIIIDAKADVNAKSLKHDTSLHKAAGNGHSDLVKILIDAQADVNAKNMKHDTSLHKAAGNGHSDLVKILIDAKADVNAKNMPN